jgi:hypothetical protein
MNPSHARQMGIALVLLGSSLYTYVAISENEKKKALANADQPHGAGALPIHSPTGTPPTQPWTR